MKVELSVKVKVQKTGGLDFVNKWGGEDGEVTFDVMRG